MPPQGPALLRPTCDVVEAWRTTAPSAAEIAERAHDAAALCYFVPDRIDGALIEALPHLRILAGFGKGVDNVDLEAATARGIWVTNVPNALTDATADLAWGLLLGLARRIAASDAFVRSGAIPGWDAQRFLGARITGQRLGLLGFGAIGQAVARRARGFAMEVRYHDLRRDLRAERELDARFVSRDELLGNADALVLALPLDERTRAGLGAEELALLAPHTLVVNVARGSLVDEAAVASALEAERLGGYASDVFALEDHQYADRPGGIDARLLDARERTLFTPHLGTAVYADRVELALVQATCVLQALRGERPGGAVNAPAIAGAQRRTPT